MQRVGLEQIPAEAASLIGQVRPRVAEMADLLLAEPVEQPVTE